MSYTALYRKWRPGNFTDVIGQDHIVKTLTNQIVANRIAHAYLFCGTRGTGKTSTAKIFAKAVNCEEPINGSPCNHCSVCNTINEGRSLNIVEIDAASNNGVDNIREIREEVKYTPTEGTYKVYIIDEVHMLSTGAFNALLKTLEEPPKHVIFVLATTEPHKIPATILSRCQRYDFKRITIKTISERLMYYLNQEAIEAEDKAIDYIAKVADGSMRDALSILDQCIAFYIGERITIDKVLEVLGAVDNQIFIDIINGLHEKDAKKCMDLIDHIIMQGRDLNQFILDLITHLRNLLVLKTVEDASRVLDMSEENIKVLKEQSGIIKEQQIIYYIQVFSELETKIKYASQKRILIEVELMRLCQPSMDNSYEGLIERIKDLEKKIEKGAIQQVVVKEQTTQVKQQPVKKVYKKAVPQDIKSAIDKWESVVRKFTGIGKAFIMNSKPDYIDGDILYIVCSEKTGKKYLSQEENISKINNVLEELNNRSFQIKVIDQEEYNMLTNNIIYEDPNQPDINYEEIQSKVNIDVKIQ